MFAMYSRLVLEHHSAPQLELGYHHVLFSVQFLHSLNTRQHDCHYSLFGLSPCNLWSGCCRLMEYQLHHQDPEKSMVRIRSQTDGRGGKLTRRRNDMTDTEKKSYIDAELCLQATSPKTSIEGALNRWDELDWAHITQSNIIHNTVSLDQPISEAL